ncbi:hypothetical protein [Mangrovicella endophytica]|uniref:hypothetical protein n=1 Tax=Mangrovicella endophytica TaxID=2066697 RepID=UPI000C9E77E1|nr:hypothetical protein [Mangrovicella endophytica]
MKACGLIAVVMLAPLPAAANCVPPWQTQFACEIPARNARAEFCRIMEPTAHPGLKEAYYTYAIGAGPTELYFETDQTYFSTKDTDIDHPTDMTMAVGYARGTYVYAFVTTEDSRDPDRIRDAEVRVYSTIDAFTNEDKDTEVLRLYCDAASIRANRDSIRP